MNKWEAFLEQDYINRISADSGGCSSVVAKSANSVRPNSNSNRGVYILFNENVVERIIEPLKEVF